MHSRISISVLLLTWILSNLAKKSCSSPFNWVCTFREICSIYFICIPVHDVFLRIPFLSLEDISLNWHGNIAILISGIWFRNISNIFSFGMQEPLVKKYDIAMRVSLNQAKMGVYPSFFCLVILSERSLSGFRTQVQNHFSLKFWLLFHLKILIRLLSLRWMFVWMFHTRGCVWGRGCIIIYQTPIKACFVYNGPKHVQLEVN